MRVPCSEAHRVGGPVASGSPPRSRAEESVSTWNLVEVFPDGVIVHGRSQRHKHVPNGVGEGDDAVALEEEYAEAVDESAAGQLVKPLSVAL